jgi:cyclic pyranopterin phosphate synthase
MIDIGNKEITKRKAVAVGTIYLDKQIISDIKENKVPKGNVLNFAEAAGLIAIKNTPFVIPHCHPVKITRAEIRFDIEKNRIKAICEIEGIDRTGFEMEALYGVNVSLLTIYDMCKVYKKEMKIGDIYLKEKSKIKIR